MNKSEFIDAVAEKSGLTKKDSKIAVDAVLDITPPINRVNFIN